MRLAPGLIAALVMLTGCVGDLPSPLPRSEIDKLRLDQIVVTVAPEASISWANAENEYVAKKQAEPGYRPKHPDAVPGAVTAQGSAPDEDTAEILASQEARDYVRSRAASRTETALNETVKPKLQVGSRSARLEVTLLYFDIPSAMQRLLVGGHPGIKAAVELKEIPTGAVIIPRQEIGAIAISGNGWGGVLVEQALEDLDIRVTRNFAERVRSWLLGPET